MVVDLNRLARLKHYKLKEMQIKHIKVVNKQLAGPGFETPHLHPSPFLKLGIIIIKIMPNINERTVNSTNTNISEELLTRLAK